MLNNTVRNIMFTLLFIVLLSIISLIFQSLGDLFHQYDPYKMPRGHAVKVFNQGDSEASTLTMLERLTVFYIYGEN